MRIRNQTKGVKCMKLMRVLTAGMLTLFASTAMASTVFVPTEDSVIFEAAFLDSDFDFVNDFDLVIFDDQDTTFVGDSMLVPVASPFDVATVDIDSNFILAICDITGCYGDTFVDFLAGDSAAVQFGEGGVMVSGVAPVPVPAAVWLFGSGLLGLVAVARRRQTAA